MLVAISAMESPTASIGSSAVVVVPSVAVATPARTLQATSDVRMRAPSLLSDPTASTVISRMGRGVPRVSSVPSISVATPPSGLLATSRNTVSEPSVDLVSLSPSPASTSITVTSATSVSSVKVWGGPS